MNKSEQAARSGKGRNSNAKIHAVDLEYAGSRTKPVLITGGAGFIGTNLADRLMSDGRSVLILDDLSRSGVEKNLDWLTKEHGDLLQVEIGDVRKPEVVNRTVKAASRVFHFAAQVAVTTSLDDPISDFEVNARGTLNVLEAIRAQQNPPPILFTSTNKVYGSLDDVAIEKVGNRYQPSDTQICTAGISDSRSIEFHSPYGCSKGCADQYVLDYARTFNLPAVVFRMSCIYGPHQCGNEDQGWIAHFLLKALAGENITLYGDGMQVRDVLFVEDLVNAFELAMGHVESLSGNAFNIGGGPKNAVSLLEVIDLISDLCGDEYAVEFDNWRAADQRYYVSDTTKFENFTGWKAKVSAQEGIRRLHRWFTENWFDSARHTSERFAAQQRRSVNTAGALN